MKYRSEIDGLRALAVLPVIFFHAGFSIFSGGFLGVDVFFVISGYLITRIILDDVSQGTFSIARFYERRARRILPALFFVMLCCIPFALIWMLPSQYLEFSRSLIAVTTFVANLFFWRESGYFAAAAGEKPMLHAWSLGVEEQYYVLFPLALLLLWRFGKRPTFYIIAVIAVISFIMCEYASRYYPSANFFLLPTRAWELFIGSICAFIHLESAPKRNDALSLTGLSLILIAIFTYSEQLRLPSAYSLAPVVGTALILLYGTRDSFVGRLLSLRLIVGIGLISYSAYLWHHPLFAFARIHHFESLSTLVMLALCAASLLLAAFSWRVIEQPFRNKQHRYYVKGRAGLWLAISTAAIIIAIGVHGHLTNGRFDSWKHSAPANEVKAYKLIDAERSRDFAYDNGDCVFNVNTFDDVAAERVKNCTVKYGGGVAVIGDSHAMNLFHVLRAANDTPYLIGLGQGMCRPNAPLPTCNYKPFLELLEQHPALFRDVIYEQSGWILMTDKHGEIIEQDEISGLPLNARVPDFTGKDADIAATLNYLDALTYYTNVTWLGPRIEPEISENAIVHLGCDHPFALRPNQEKVFKDLDTQIANAVAKTDIHYSSQMDLMQFDMAKDFMDCEVTYWKDRNHYSEEGEKRFGERITFETILGPL